MNTKAISVHAHFIPSPAKTRSPMNPVEPGAAPNPNWNEKIYDQCYHPNAEQGIFEKSVSILDPRENWLEGFHPKF
jgi:hypothetical protein